jgi:hypothetical protein
MASPGLGFNGRRRREIAFNITSTAGNGALVVSGDDYKMVASATQTAIGLISVVFQDRFSALVAANFNVIEATPAGSQVQIKTADVSGAPATCTKTVVLAVGAAGAYAAKYLVAGDKILCRFLMAEKP